MPQPQSTHGSPHVIREGLHESEPFLTSSNEPLVETKAKPGAEEKGVLVTLEAFGNGSAGEGHEDRAAKRGEMDPATGKILRYLMDEYILGMTIIMAIMVIINVVEAYRLEVLKNRWYTVGIPLLVYLFMLLLLGWYIFSARYGRVRKEWNETSASHRANYLGSTISFVLPIILCQFLYMEIVVYDTVRHVEWTTSIDFDHAIAPPAIAIGSFNNNILTGPGENGAGDCNTSSGPSCHLNVYEFGPDDNFVVFNPIKDPKNSAANISFTGGEEYLSLSLRTNCEYLKSTATRYPCR